jgi:acyl-CoA dehydrogenase
MDFSVPEDLKALVASFRSFLHREVRPVEDGFAERLRQDDWDEEMTSAGIHLRRRSAELGFYAAHMPEEVGGGGLSNLGYTLLVEEGASTGMQFAGWALGPPDPAAPNPILMDLPPHLRERFVPPLVRGETTMCFALTEPGAGSDAQAISASARLEDGCWVLNGTKHMPGFAAGLDDGWQLSVRPGSLRPCERRGCRKSAGSRCPRVRPRSSHHTSMPDTACGT